MLIDHCAAIVVGKFLCEDDPYLHAFNRPVAITNSIFIIATTQEIFMHLIDPLIALLK